MAKKSLDEITKEYFSDFKRSKPIFESRGGVLDSIVGGESYSSQELQKSFEVTKPREFTYQSYLRPLFGKEDVNESKVGAHPDFAHLKDSGDIDKHYIVTMFVDIKKSSRLAMLMPLNDAYIVKNRILQACVDVVRALDGYPHRLMGDALMSYFGDKNTCKEDAIANALNAASTLKLLLTEHVFSELDSMLDADVELGIRIGLDFGDDHEVIWANYGYGDASEVTALGIPVDLAAKAQSQAETNTAMLGEGVLSFIDFPKKYSKVKIVEKDGEKKEERYILPNMTYQDGTTLNRVCKLLLMDCYQANLPLPVAHKKGKKSNIQDVRPHDAFEFYCKYNDGDGWVNYHSVSKFLEKGVSLKFYLKAESNVFQMFDSLIVDFTKENHGEEAKRAKQEGIYRKNKEMKMSYKSNLYFYEEVEEEESTLYRGLHTMHVKVYPKGNSNMVLFEDKIGIYIK